MESMLREIAAGVYGDPGGMRLRIDAASLDQVNIISSWLRTRGAEPSTMMLEPGWAAERFTEVAEWATQAAPEDGGGLDGVDENQEVARTLESLADALLGPGGAGFQGSLVPEGGHARSGAWR